MTDKPILTVHPQGVRPVVLPSAQVDEWVERVLRASPPVGQFERVMREREFWAEAERKNYSFLFILSQAWLITALLLAGSLVVLTASLSQTTFSKIGFVFGILFWVRCFTVFVNDDLASMERWRSAWVSAAQPTWSSNMLTVRRTTLR